MNYKLESFLNKVKCGVEQTACIFELVDIYYQCVIGRIDEIDDDDELYEDNRFPEELLDPVEKRSTGIGSAIEELLQEGYDIDASKGGFNALMIAVGTGDAPMVRFLIQHGSDANSWPEKREALSQEEASPISKEQNWYLEDIDIHYMNECLANDRDVNYLEALYRTALVLVEDAHLGPYCGTCLSISENSEVSLDPPHVMF